MRTADEISCNENLAIQYMYLYTRFRLKAMLWIGQGQLLVAWQLVIAPKTFISGIPEMMVHGM